MVFSTLFSAALGLAFVPSTLGGVLPICPRDVAAVCSSLNTNFGTSIAQSTEPEYAGLRTENCVPQSPFLYRPHRSETAWRTPACIFRPSSASDLQDVVTVLVGSNTPFAIRSGGHSPDPHAANIDGGVLIDLSLFNTVTYDAINNVAVIGAGLRWGEVYSQLALHNVTVVGGRVLDVGVGGLLLGSGLSYLSDLYGLACDNVVNFEVVLADGSLVNANAVDNPELFWSLKGGGNNFGIVTAFTLTTIADRQVWGGLKLYDIEYLPDLYTAMLEYQTAAEKDLYANLMLQGFITSSGAAVQLNLIYFKDEVAPAAFAPFYSIPTTADTTTLSSFTDFLATQGPAMFPPRVDWHSSSFEPNADVYSAIHDIVTSSAELSTITGVTSGTLAFGVQPITTNLIEQGILKGGNALGLSNVNQTWHVIDLGWQSSADDTTVHTAAKTMKEDIIAAAVGESVDLDYIFANDASWDQDVFGSYGSVNIARLKAAQAIYDPTEVFQRLVPGGFKLPPTV
ncbi:hypothetical protein B0T17DRAFT_593042 [Bombardia bombarda]|uniref:FAD-binding PCMH-type domain-containing protein n=1 Tax=Bombardia bombarda TaxID=252184 RepID=A0AA40BVN6_9PEZI|nr:hypothetical protein B0T17DRAFT_593042 [Bombardia bombarda]